MKSRGFWRFDINRIDDKFSFVDALRSILTILIEDEVLIPKTCHYDGFGSPIVNIPENLSTDEIIDFILELDPSKVRGWTAIYDENNKVMHQGILTFYTEFRELDEFNFSIQANSDIWLPMYFEEETYSLIWNLERYRLNYHRIMSILHKINNLVRWDSSSENYIDYNERCGVQIGYDLFLCREVIIREYEAKPNSAFDLEAYLQKLQDAEQKARSSTES